MLQRAVSMLLDRSTSTTFSLLAQRKKAKRGHPDTSASPYGPVPSAPVARLPTEALSLRGAEPESTDGSKSRNGLARMRAASRR